MSRLNRPSETVSESIDSRIQAQRESTALKVEGVVGILLEGGSDIAGGIGKLGMYTIGRVAHGIGETYGALRDGLSGKSYPTGK